MSCFYTPHLNQGNNKLRIIMRFKRRPVESAFSFVLCIHPHIPPRLSKCKCTICVMAHYESAALMKCKSISVLCSIDMKIRHNESLHLNVSTVNYSLSLFANKDIIIQLAGTCLSHNRVVQTVVNKKISTIKRITRRGCIDITRFFKGDACSQFGFSFYHQNM